ncbi:hypothetical protein [Streptomyces sp. TP-A0356]|uniref:hypothetical protein n=1 Tax=Streptomyces sp. TP-A0356 TaxID=1359208 RepID=UPI0006E2212B|nr:hypothetical protein [Streptomyces sp. TP-A0356]
MTVKLNAKAFDHAKKLIEDDRIVLDDRDEWSEHQPSAAAENAYIEKHGLDEYARWYLGIDDAMGEDTKGRYKFPYGDFERLHRCGVLSAEVRAAQQKYTDIEQAAAHLHGMLDGRRAEAKGR